ncbi:MAG: hypothetical protein ACPG7F_01245, partial [Aggregatilineales bacterium]
PLDPIWLSNNTKILYIKGGWQLCTVDCENRSNGDLFLLDITSGFEEQLTYLDPEPLGLTNKLHPVMPISLENLTYDPGTQQAYFNIMGYNDSWLASEIALIASINLSDSEPVIHVEADFFEAFSSSYSPLLQIGAAFQRIDAGIYYPVEAYGYEYSSSILRFNPSGSLESIYNYNYFDSLTSRSLSPDKTYFAFSEVNQIEFSGKITIVNLDTGQEVWKGEVGNVCHLFWGDNNTIFYVEQDRTNCFNAHFNLPPDRIFRHEISTNNTELIFDGHNYPTYLVPVKH